jgi:hypothetical protein
MVTAEKPEAKLWWNDGYWWGSLWSTSGNAYHIHRLDIASQQWIDTGTRLDARSNTKADVLWDGQPVNPSDRKLYVASHPWTTDGSAASVGHRGQLFRYSYDAGVQQYTLDPGFPVEVNGARSESLSIAKDSTSQLWVTWVEDRQVMINHSLNGDDTSWGMPFVLPVGAPADVSSDDLSAVAAFDGNKIAVMWSNQSSGRNIHVATHQDGASDNDWQEAVAYGTSGDDHVNVKSFSDSAGQLFAVVKTESSSTGLIVLLVCENTVTDCTQSSDWASYSVYDTGGGTFDATRPILLIDETNRELYVFVSLRLDANANRVIAYKRTPLDNIQFAPGTGTVFIEDVNATQINDPSSTHQVLNGSTGLVVLASADDQDRYYHGYLELAGSPDVAIAPTSHDYGTRLTGTSVTQAFAISNTGATDLMVGQSSLTGPGAGSFAFVSGQAGFTIPPGGVGALEVSFTPLGVGLKSATLNIPSNDPDENPLAIALTGTGVAPPSTPPTLEEIRTGGSGSSSVTTSTSLTGVDGHLYLAAVSSRPSRTVNTVTGLGLTWTRLDIQCSGRNLTAVEVWWALGPATSGTVRATFTQSPSNSVIAVARYSGVAATDPVAPLVAGNTNGIDGTCSGGSDQNTYSLPVTTTDANAVVFGAVALRYRTHTPGSGYTERAEVGRGSSWNRAGLAIVDQAVAVPSSLPLNGSFNGSVDWAVIGAQIRPSASVPAPADIDATPTSVNYGDVAVGASMTESVTVRNLGDFDLDVTAITLEGPDGADFLITQGDTPVLLPAGGSHRVDVRFAPASIGPKAATLRLVSDDPDENPYDISLTGGGVLIPVPHIAVTPTSRDFGSQATGTTVTQLFTVSNTGTADLVVAVSTLTGPDAGAFALGNGQAGFTIPPGGSGSLEVRFSPTIAGHLTATLNIPSNDPDDSPLIVPLAGFAVQVLASGTPHVAEVQTGGSESDTVTTATSLTGVSGDLYLAAISTRTPQAVDTVTGLGLTWARFAVQCAARDQTGLEVWWAQGAADDGVVTATFVQPPTNAVIAVTRYAGVSATDAVAPLVAANTNGVDGACAGGTDQNAYSLNVTTTVDDAAVFAAVALRHRTHTPGLGYTESAEVAWGSGGEIVGLATVDQAVPQASSLPLDGSFSGVLDWVVIGVEIRPNVPTPDIDVVPNPEHDYGAVTTGTSVTTTFTVSNMGTADLVLEPPTLGGADAGSFALGNGQGGFVVPPGGVGTLDVSFTPLTEGPKNATVTVRSNDPDENPVSISLTGTGVLIMTPPTIEDVRTGGSGSDTVTTATSLAGVNGHLYLAAIASRSYRAVSMVTGLGLSWTRIAAQCSGRDATGVEVWWAQGAASDGPVTATFVQAPNNAVITVAHYAGVAAADPVTLLGAANTNGIDGACSGGTDQNAYSFDVTTTANDAVVFGAVALRNRSHTPGNGYTEWSEAAWGSGGDVAGLAIVDQAVPFSSSLPLDGSFSSQVDWAVVGVQIRPGGSSPAPGDIDVTPSSATDYGSVALGAGLTQTFTVRNLGGTNLDVTAITLQGANSADFAITQGEAPVLIPPGALHRVDVRFAPTSLGPRAATLRLSSNDPDESPYDISMSGTGVDTPVPDIAVTPTSRDFGDQPTGTSVTQAFTISNMGTADLVVGPSTLIGPDASEFSWVSGQAGFTISPGGEGTLEVSFTPLTGGPKSAFVNIPSDDPDENPVVLPLTGTGVTGSTTPPIIQEVRTGGSASDIVMTASSLTGVNGQLYLAAIASKPYRAADAVTGLGLTWARIAAQCAGRDTSGVEVWWAQGAASDGTVTATFAQAPNNSVIVVARYAEVATSDPVSPLGTANTNGVGGACSGGTDQNAYSIDVTTTASDAVVFGAVAMRNRSHSPGSGYTEWSEVAWGSGGDVAGLAVVDEAVPLPSTLPFEGLFSSQIDWAIVGVQIRPAASLP